MKHLTPEILRAAALRLWDGVASNFECMHMGYSILLTTGYDRKALIEFRAACPSDWSVFEGIKGAPAIQAARFDFLNLLAASLED